MMSMIHWVKRQELTRPPWGPPSGWGQVKEMPVGEAMQRRGTGGQPHFRGGHTKAEVPESGYHQQGRKSK